MNECMLEIESSAEISTVNVHHSSIPSHFQERYYKFRIKKKCLIYVATGNPRVLCVRNIRSVNNRALLSQLSFVD